MGFHRDILSDTAVSTWPSRMAAYHLKISPSNNKLLFISGDSSPCKDLVISLDNLLLPLVTLGNLGVTMDNQVSFFAISDVLLLIYS